MIVPPGPTCYEVLSAQPFWKTHELLWLTEFCVSMAGNELSNSVISSPPAWFPPKSPPPLPPSRSSSASCIVVAFPPTEPNWSASSPRAARSRARKSSWAPSVPWPLVPLLTGSVWPELLLAEKVHEEVCWVNGLIYPLRNPRWRGIDQPYW